MVDCPPSQFKQSMWLAHLSVNRTGAVVKETLVEVFRASMSVDDYEQTEKVAANITAGPLQPSSIAFVKWRNFPQLF